MAIDNLNAAMDFSGPLLLGTLHRVQIPPPLVLCDGTHRFSDLLTNTGWQYGRFTTFPICAQLL